MTGETEDLLELLLFYGLSKGVGAGVRGLDLEILIYWNAVSSRISDGLTVQLEESPICQTQT